MATTNPILSRADATMAQLKPELDETISQTKRATAVIQEGANTVDAATDAIVGLIDQQTSAKKIVDITQKTAELQVQQANNKILEAAGGHAKQQELMARLTEDEGKMEELLNKKTEIMSEEFTGIGLIDGIINSFRVIDTEIQYDSAKAERDHTVDQIKNVTASKESFATVNRHFKQGLTAASIEAGAAAIEAEGRLMAEKAKLDGASQAANSMALVTQANMQTIRARIEANNLAGSVEQRELDRVKTAQQEEQFAHEKEKWPIIKQQAQLQMERMKMENEDYTKLRPDQVLAKQSQAREITKTWNDVQALETERVQAIRFAEAKYSLTPSSPQAIADGLARQDPKYWTLLQTSTTGRLAQTPADAKEVWTSLDPTGTLPLNTGTALIRRFERVQADKYAADPTLIPKDPKLQKADFNKIAEQEMAKYATNILPGTDNPYEAKPLGVLAEALDKKNIPLWAKVLKEQGMMETNPQLILEAAANAVLAKRITAAEAAQGVVDIFGVAAEINNSFQYGFTEIGLLPQNSYKTEILKAPSLFEIAKTVAVTQLTNPLSQLSAFQPAAPIADVIGNFNPEMTAGYQINEILSTKTIVPNLMDYNEAADALTHTVARIKRAKE